MDLKAIRADFLVGLVVGLVGERICGLDLTVVSVFGGSIVWPLLDLDGSLVLGILVRLASIL